MNRRSLESLERWREQITLVPPKETLSEIARHVQAKLPGAYLRFGDGDVRLMAGVADVLQKQSPALTLEMQEAFLLEGPGIFKSLALDCRALGLQPGMQYKLFGMTDADALNMLRYAGRYFAGQKSHSHSALAYLSIFDPQSAVDFLLALKAFRPLFVGNEYIPPRLVQTLFGHTGHVPAPSRDAYAQIDRIEADIRRFLQWDRPYPVIVLALGCAGRPLAKRFIRSGFKGFIFDFGSLIDALAGASTRDWIRLAPHNPRQIFDLDWPRTTPRPYVQKPNHRGPEPAQFNVRWEGPQLLHHSFAVINRELCIQLARDARVDLSISPLWPNQFTPDADERFPLLYERFFQLPAGPIDVTVRHKPWPDFRPPAEGHWVTIQPWEYANIPEDWIKPMQNEVDEVWVHSQFVHDCYVRGGLTADRLQYIPLGVNTHIFRPDAAPTKLETDKRYKFLFVGGTQWRKGTDILLKAYHKAFSDRDDVCLVIKDLGNKTFYKGASYDKLLADLQRRAGAPQVLYLDSLFSDSELAGLYAACDCYVQPYRAEGFALPIAEAMACGLPVVVTDRGPAIDFVTEATGYMLPSRITYMNKRWPGVSREKARIEYAEPDEGALIELMRHAVSHPEQLHQKGQAGSVHIRENWTWERSAQAVIRRFEALRELPIRRQTNR
ncbi:MAG TPA: glycosyltransferase family 4 protein [Anaerolineales bacterium]